MRAVSILAMMAALAAGAANAQIPLSQTPLAGTQQPLAQPLPPAPDLPTPQDIDYPGMLTVSADATDLDHHIIRIHEVIPVAASGPMVVMSPSWIPGTHTDRSDSDPTKIAGVTFSADGKTIPWTRDEVHVHAFHIDVPEGAKTVTLDFQFLTPLTTDDGVIVHTKTMMDLEWWFASMYPAGYYTRRIPVQASLTLPTGWEYATALETDHRDGDVVHFKPISYDNLIDSPVLAGRYFKAYDLDPGGPVPVHMDLVADDPKELEVPDAAVKLQGNIVREAYRLFGGYHYNHYDFLVAVSGPMGGIGLEHHRSSEDAVEPGYFQNTAGKGMARNILGHEYVHSWDGKFRRPDGQFTPTFEEPMRDSLLWVYEGGTTYWGEVLEGRAGLYTLHQNLDMWAATAAMYQNLPGLDWRTVQDTTNDSTLSDRNPKSWPSWQLSEDYYAAGSLIWFEADTLIRQKTGGKKSLDDFAKAFFGVYNGSWQPLTYSFDDVVKTLNSVYPYDWATFLRDRLDKTQPDLLGGIRASGYQLVYNDEPNAAIKARGGANLTTSLGLNAGKDGAIRAVMWNSPAFKAGLAKGMTIKAVNDKAFDPDTLTDLIKANEKTSDTIDMLVQDGDTFRTVRFDYHDGLRIPHLERVAGTPDLFKAIFTTAK
ncbi:MAG TPA: peptidase M61 [Asticcacaulis sp.]|nr:peptidase M61 [Asticcacaulis sp.]